MILVDLWFPYLEKSYDFWLDETAPCQQLAGEIWQSICDRESIKPEQKDMPVLFVLAKKQVLPPGAALRTCMVQSGETLMLV